MQNEDLVLLLGQIDGKLDLVLEGQKDHARRLTALEKDRSMIRGGFLGIGAVLTWLGKDHIAGFLGSLFN